jgi:hypothetical protein
MTNEKTKAIYQIEIHNNDIDISIDIRQELERYCKSMGNKDAKVNVELVRIEG